jgi:serine/threonine protein kinase
MCGLASALRLIHTFRTTIDLKPRGGFLLNDDSKLEVVPGEEKYGRHGDIKPENILWFKNVDGSIVLQITDFGLGRFHGRDSRSNVDPKTVNATPTYEPPECKLEKPVSRAYDIWSVACLYLEFITWLLEGTQAIHDFGDARGERGEPSLTINDKRYTIIRDAIINDDNFFTIIRIGDNSRRAVVRDAVVEWVKRLHTHKNCSDVLHDLLDLVMDHLLRPDSGERITSTHLKDKMDAILGKAKSDQDYLLKPSPRVCLSPAPSLAASRGGPSGRGVRWVETWPTKSSPISPRSPI